MDSQREITSKPLTNAAEPQAVWTTPIMTELKLQDAESGINVSENGATGS